MYEPSNSEHTVANGESDEVKVGADLKPKVVENIHDVLGQIKETQKHVQKFRDETPRAPYRRQRRSSQEELEEAVQPIFQNIEKLEFQKEGLGREYLQAVIAAR